MAARTAGISTALACLLVGQATWRSASLLSGCADLSWRLSLHSIREHTVTELSLPGPCFPSQHAHQGSMDW